MPKHSPNVNPDAESFVRNINRECLSQMILFDKRHARYVIEQYVEHYNLERRHKGLSIGGQWNRMHHHQYLEPLAFLANLPQRKEQYDDY